MNQIKKYFVVKVIDKWEIGLSQFMISRGLKIGHHIDSEEITKQFKIRSDSNISHTYIKNFLKLDIR